MILKTNIFTVKILLALAAVVAFLSTPLVKALSVKVGAVDVPKDGRRMHDHLLGLVDNDDIRILVQDVKRNIFRLNIQLSDLGNRNRHQVSWQKAAARLNGKPVDADLLLLDELLDIRPGAVWKHLCQIPIDAFLILILSDVKFFQNILPLSGA